MLREIRLLPTTVWVLGLISLLNDATGELVYPLVPLLVVSVLMAGPRALGLIEGVAEATSSLLKLASGVLVDRVQGTRWWITGGYGLAAVSRPLLALAGSWPIVLLLRVADRIGKGLRSSPRDALLASAVQPGQRGLAFGFHRAMDNAGSVIGPLLAAALLARHMPIREIFLWACVPGFLAVLLALSLRPPAAAVPPAGRSPLDWRLGALPPVFRRYLLVLALFTLCNSSNMFLLLRARDMGLADYQIPLLWALMSATAMFLSTPLSALSDRIGRYRLIAFGWSVYGLFYLLMGLSSAHPGWVWPLFAIYGVFMAATEGAEKALVADLAPPEKLGTAYGWFNLIAGLTLLPASLLFGWLWQAFTPRLAFSLAAAGALLAALLLHVWVATAATQQAKSARE